MQISLRASVTMIHGMFFGCFFMMAVFAAVVEMIASTYTAGGFELSARGRSLAAIYLTLTAALGWLAVLGGTYIVYPWYRVHPPAGITDLTAYPQWLLLSSGATSGWHELGMEWKEHVAWLAPIAMTMTAYVLIAQRAAVKQCRQIRHAVLVFACVALVSAGIAAFFGAMINKQAPVNGGPEIHLFSER